MTYLPSCYAPADATPADATRCVPACRCLKQRRRAEALAKPTPSSTGYVRGLLHGIALSAAAAVAVACARRVMVK